jgi:hypothetical protein
MTASRSSTRSATSASVTAMAVVVAVLAAACLSPPAARADKAVAALAKYKAPVDKAIEAALAYLAKAQLEDGNFPGDMPKNSAVTSLAVMAFLAKGNTPGVGPYGEVINKSIDAVLASQHENGLLSGGSRSHGSFGYSHNICTLMLSEITGMVDVKRQEKVDAALSKALKLILAAQQVKKGKSRDQGGWRYQHVSTDSDISCTGWALMSLRSARNNGAAIPGEAIAQALKYVMNCRAKDGGFCYLSNGSNPGLARTGTALLCLELCGQHRSKVCLQAGDWILAHLQTKYGDSNFYYGLYYTAQGMFQLSGEHWEKFGAHLYEMMLRFQHKDGSWPQGSGNESKAGPCYATAMSVLAMSVSYRQLPIYQRGD